MEVADAILNGDYGRPTNTHVDVIKEMILNNNLNKAVKSGTPEMIKKIYITKEGPSVYINNEKVVISKQAAKVLNFDYDPFDGSISSRVLSFISNSTISKNSFTEPKDEDIIKTAELCHIEEIDKEIKGFRFKGWFIFKEDICIGINLERNGRLINIPGTPEEGYQKIKGQLEL